MIHKKILFSLIIFSIFLNSCTKPPFIDFKVKVADSTVTIIPIYENAESINWEVDGFKTISTLDTFSIVIPIQKVGQKTNYYNNWPFEMFLWSKFITIKATASNKHKERTIVRECSIDVEIPKPKCFINYYFNSEDGSQTVHELGNDTAAKQTTISNKINIVSRNSVIELDSIPKQFGSHTVHAKILFANKTWLSTVCDGEVKVIVSSSDNYSLNGTFEGTLYNAANCSDVGILLSGDFIIVY
jgi:hypothetical protein